MDLVKLGLAILVLLIIDFAVEFLINQKVKERRKSIKYRVALRYVLFFTLLFTVAKIWVDGFGYLLGIAGVVAAALTITQKEYIMNVVGWLIIMWRDLFVEGDIIEIGKHTGYVRHMGPLYFFIDELFEGDRTGRVVKIPNSVVATQPIINFSAEKHFIEGRQYFIFSFESSFPKLYQLMHQMETELEQYLFQLNADRTSKQQREFAKTTMQCQCILRVLQDKDRAQGIQMKVRYYSLKQDQKKVGDFILAIVLQAVGEELMLSEAV